MIGPCIFVQGNSFRLIVPDVADDDGAAHGDGESADADKPDDEDSVEAARALGLGSRCAWRYVRTRAELRRGRIPYIYCNPVLPFLFKYNKLYCVILGEFTYIGGLFAGATR
jgi:hypothetical protein